RDGLRQLVRDMTTGQVQISLLIGTNPVYTVPADLDFATAFAKVPLRISMSLYEDETSALCDWHIPETHALEGWSDARAYDGTVSIVQPLIAPLYEGKSPHELLAAALGTPDKSGHDVLRDYWNNLHAAQDFETA